MNWDSITNWNEIEELDNYPELERYCAEMAVHAAEMYPPELTALWDSEIRADAMAGVI